MSSETYERIRSNPKFQQLVASRSRFAWTLSIIVLVTFYSFVMLVAFSPQTIGIRLGGSTLTLGVAACLAMYVGFWLLTALYVRRANTEFDRMTAEIVKEAQAPAKPVAGKVGATVASLLLAVLPALADAAGPDIGTAQKQPVNYYAIGMFLVFVALTMGITWWASRRNRTAADFYTAGGGITGFQNGLAIAGDYMSAATLLGITAMVYTQGFDGYMYAISFFVGWPVILFLMAERLRNLGRFTFADITSYRLDQGKVRTMAAISSLTVVVFYLIAQMVGAGQLIKLLFGLDYPIAVVAVGTLMMVYVIFGGMTATTWVQIIKACMLLAGGTLVMVLAMSRFGFSYSTLVERVTTARTNGWKLFMPGPLTKDPVNAISLAVGLMFGTAGLPHILMRFFTVSDAKEARKSVIYASGFVAYFFNVIFLMGLTAILVVGGDPAFFQGGKVENGINVGGAVVGGGNMIAMHLARAVGGNLMLGFLAAVAFATILAVVSGLALAGASAISHDLYARVIKKGQVSEEKEIRVSKIATICLGIVAIALGIIFEKQNVAFMVGLAFGVAAAANFPVLILSMYWKGLTTRGALAGGFSGLVSAVTFVLLSKSVWVAVFKFPAPIFPYDQPALFAMPIAFLMAFVVSKADASARARAEEEAFADQYVRAQTGFGAAGASKH